MIKTVIIDDEVAVRNNIKTLIKENVSGVEVIGEADSVKNGLTLLNNVQPDLLLLDVNLADGSGFNILENLNQVDFKIIFITAFDQYAVKAFQFNALDYILKPVDIDQFKKAIDKMKDVVESSFITKEDLKTILDNYTKKDEERQLALPEAHKISFVNLKDIVRCQADGNYTVFYLKDGSSKVTSKTLKKYEEILPSTMFFRVNISNIINLKKVKEFNKEGYVVLDDNTTIEVSRRRKAGFLEAIERSTS